MNAKKLAAVKCMDDFQALIAVADTKDKLILGDKIFNFISDETNSIECEDIGLFIDALVPWCHSSNHKVTLIGIEILTALAERMKSDFRSHVSIILMAMIERLGDSKEAVRKKAQHLLLTLMSQGAMSPAYLFEKLATTGFMHKNSYIREESLKCLLSTIEIHGVKSVGVQKLLPLIIKLLSDSSVTVREAAMNTMVELYKNIGDPFKYSLLKNQSVPPNKMQHILENFDKVSGCVKEGDDNFSDTNSLELDEVDRSANKVAVKKIAPLLGSASQPSSLRQIRMNSGLNLKRNGDSLPRTGSDTPKACLDGNSSEHPCISKKSPKCATAAAGAVDEDSFLKSFEDVPKVQIFSGKNVCEQMMKIKETLENGSIEWDKRVDALKRFRSLLVAGASNYEEFFQNLRYLELCFQTSCKDLRSQVVRETSITVSFLSASITSKAEHFCEFLFPVLINLIQNSAKVISTSGLVCIRIVLKNTHSPRFIPIISQSLQSKSREIRRACCEFLDLIVHSWSTHSLEKHVGLLQDAIKRGITDPDSEARALSRKAYFGFSEIFPEQAEVLYNSLGNVYKKAVSGDASNFGSTNSLNQPSITQPTIKPIKYPETSQMPQSYSNRRKSNSAIDLQAAQRAKARAHYAALARQKVGSGVSSLQRTAKVSTPEPIERTSRTRSRMSVSQPSSRSSSPSSKLNSLIYSPSSRARRGSSGIPRSTDTSREPSPNRFSSKHIRGRPPIQSPARPVMAQKMLQQSREVESALADALGSTPDSHSSLLISPRRSYRSFDERSDDSETSSICSERSFDISGRKSSDPYSWNHHHNAHSRFSNCDPEELKNSIGEIVISCESVDWGDRKDGLVSLQRFFQAGNKLSPSDLKHVCDVFTKMFSDSYTKVFSLFLDTLNELIIAHAADLHSWLYLLLTRLFNKSGTDLLNSIQTKIFKTLKIVREVFPSNVQLHSVFRYLVDPTQTPNPKSKLAVLNFITSLAAKSNPSQAFVAPENQKDYSLPALKKMVGWIMGDNIKNGPELKRAAQEAVLALFNLNAPQVTLRFSQFPQEYQEAASNLIKMRLRRSNSGSSNGPYSPGYDSFSAASSHDENINPEEVYQTLVRTTAEIQKYSVESGFSGEAESHDSGISQLSQHDKTDTQPYQEGTSPVDTADSSFDSSEKDEQSLCKALDDMSITEDNSSAAVDSKTEIAKLNDLVCHSSGPVLEKNFKGILRRVIQLLADPDPKIREASILLLYSLIKNSAITHCFTNYVELLILKLFETIQDSSRVASRVAELCALAASSILPTKQVLRTVVPLITAEDFPVNALAIKMLTQVTQPENSQFLQDYITVIMPGLLQCYENQDSSVRKSAVFCMVALHKVLGEDVLAPYLNTLNGAKLKLLHLYIKRSSQNQSPTSPKNN